MSEDAIIKGCYADYRRIKGRKVLQLIIEVPLEQAPLVHEAFGEPDPAGDTWVAVALLQPETTRVAVKKDEHRLSRQAALACQEPAFEAFLKDRRGFDHGVDVNVPDAVRFICKVESRAEFDTDPDAAQRWRDLHGEYLLWLRD